MRPILRLFGVVPDPERELDEEIAAHLEMTQQALRAHGMGEDEARAEALRRFGDVRAHRRAMMRLDEGRWRRMKIRESWGRIIHTVGTSMRAIRRSPGFAVAVMLTLALGLGANAVMFGVVDRLLLSPPQHVVEPDDVRRVWMLRTLDVEDPAAEPIAARALTWPDYEDLSRAEGIVEAGAYSSPSAMILGRGEDAREVQVVRATPSLFSLLGVTPSHGRLFRPGEDDAGLATVAVISHGFWTRAFGADPDVLGTLLDIGPERWEVVGVAPPGFTGAELAPVDVWLPAATWMRVTDQENAFDNRNWWWASVAVRVADGASEAAAFSEASSYARAGREEAIAAGAFDPNARFAGGPLTQGGGPSPSPQASVSRWLAGVSLIVLLVACANVANLLLARATRLRHELDVRVALGATRSRLVAEMMTETGVLAVFGAGAATVLAFVGAPLLHDALIPNVAFSDAGLGVRLVAFVAVATLVTVVLAGAVPAIRAASAAEGRVSRGTRGTTRRRSHLQVGLLVLQGALSVVLLIGSGLFVRSLESATSVDLGFDARRVLLMEIAWEGPVPEPDRAAVYRQAMERVAALPGVSGAATSYMVPFEGSWSIGAPAVPGLDEYPDAVGGGPYLNRVSAGYFETMGLEIERGRGFEELDDDPAAPPVAVVGRRMVDDVWRDTDPLGQCMYFGEDGPCTRVVGIVEDHRRQALVEAVPHHMYYLNASHPALGNAPNVMMLRTSDGVRGDPRPVIDEVVATSPLVRFVEARPLLDVIEPQVRSFRLGASMFSAFGMLALVVAAIGLYSVLSFDVAQRRREMGVRAALGATRNGILAMVVRSAVGLTAIGLVVGVVIALGASRFLQPLLFEVSATDPGVYAGVVALLLGVGVAASFLPGWRATRIDPSEALRAE